MKTNRKTMYRSAWWLTLAALALPMLFCSCGVVVRPVEKERGPDRKVVVVDESRPHRGPLGIPPGHLPPPGQCRIWIPGKPPGHQPRPGACSDLEHRVPPGAWLVRRPAHDPRHVQVLVYDNVEPSLVVVIRHYVAASGEFEGEERVAKGRVSSD
jgi:hypothetical protein